MARIPFETIVAAPIDSVVRMARWMGVCPVRKPRETDRQYRARTAKAIARAEKEET